MLQGNPSLIAGNVVVVDQPGSVRATIGDQIQLRVFYGIVPGGLLSDLDVEITGSSVRLTSVDHTPNLGPNGHPQMGAGVLTAFLVADQSGDSLVKVTPIGDGEHQSMLYAIGVSLPTQ